MECLLFKNPEISFRKEKFGGLVKLQHQILILGKKEFSLLEKIEKYIDYNSLNKKQKLLADRFLNLCILFKINKNHADKLIRNFSKNLKNQQ